MVVWQRVVPPVKVALPQPEEERRSARVRLALVKSALRRVEECESASHRLASRKVALRRFELERSVPTSSASRKVVPTMFEPERSCPEKSSPSKSHPFRLALGPGLAQAAWAVTRPRCLA